MLKKISKQLVNQVIKSVSLEDGILTLTIGSRWVNCHNATLTIVARHDGNLFVDLQKVDNHNCPYCKEEN